MRLLYVLLVTVLLSGCSVVDIYEQGLWPQYAYPGFSEKIDRIAGSGAIDCGFYDRVSRDSDSLKKERSGLSDCVVKSIEKGRTFKFGSVRIPTDSYAYEVLVLSPDNEFWTITFDLMLDGSNAIHWVKRCEWVNVDIKSLSYKGDVCREVSAEEWLSDI